MAKDSVGIFMMVILHYFNFVQACDPVLCGLYCEYGFVVDETGCEICQCFHPCGVNEPLTDASGDELYCGLGGDPCPLGATCITDPVDRFAVCCSACDPVLCELHCEYGFDVDENGCEICQCLEPCEGVFCLPGIPTPERIECFAPPCIPAYTCSCQPCPLVRCSTRCPLGFQLDENECSTCLCRDPCQGEPCTSREVCDLEPIFCIRAPCPPAGVCRLRVCGANLPLKDGFEDVQCDDRTPCPAGYTCNENKGVCCPESRCFLPADSGPCLDYETAYHYDPGLNQCLPFTYGGCGGNRNRFNTLRKCERKCVSPTV